MTELNKSTRINVVDSLRGFAVIGIIMIHFLEHMNFMAARNQTAFDNAIRDTVFFLGSSKMYAIFALLFGFSCYIQHHNQEKRGVDFRPRFAWRMILLFAWGMLDLCFYNGDILVTYAIIGLLLIPMVKLSDKALAWLAFIFFLQPIEIVYMILGSLNPEISPMNLGIGKLWGYLFMPCAQGSLLDVAKVNLHYGVQLNVGWAIEHGRFTQTLFLFILGMLMGRKRLFLDEGNNLAFWKKVLIGSVAAFAVLFPLWKTVPSMIGNKTVSASAEILLNAWRNFSMMSFYVAGIILLYYKTSARKGIEHLSYIGKMSLSCYLIQSIVGGFLFYHWGLCLYNKCGHAVSFGLSVIFLFCLYWICRYWTTHHRRGPLEEIWSRLTFIGVKR